MKRVTVQYTEHCLLYSLYIVHLCVCMSCWKWTEERERPWDRDGSCSCLRWPYTTEILYDGKRYWQVTRGHIESNNPVTNGSCSGSISGTGISLILSKVCFNPYYKCGDRSERCPETQSCVVALHKTRLTTEEKMDNRRTPERGERDVVGIVFHNGFLKRRAQSTTLGAHGGSQGCLNEKDVQKAASGIVIPLDIFWVEGS